MNRRANSMAYAPMPIQQEDYVRIDTRDIVSQTHIVYLDSDVIEVFEYRNLLTSLMLANEGDHFDLIMNSDGGMLTTAQAIVQSIRNTRASVRAIIMGSCHSAMSYIALNCPEVVVMPSAEMMVHTANFGAFGSTGNVANQVSFSVNQVSKMIDETYGGFMTAKEIVDVKKGVEFWFSAEDISKRIKRRTKWLSAKTSTEMNEVMADE